MSLQDRLTELRDQGLADIKSADALKRLTKSKLICLVKRVRLQKYCAECAT